jgi:hypothetical protein
MISNVLKAFASQYFPAQYMDEILAEIEKSGSISDETLKKAGIGKRSTVDFIKNQVRELAPKNDLKELSKSQLQSLVGTGENVVDEANLDDAGLSTRKDIYGQLGNTKGQLDRGSIEKELINKLKVANVHEESVPRVAQQLADQIMQLGHYPSAEEFQAGYPGFISPELKNFFTNQDTRNQFSGSVQDQLEAPDTFNDIKRIDDILATRGQKRANEGELDSFLTSLPGELEKSRTGYLDALSDQANVNMEYAVPQQLAGLNARGALFSGDVQDVLSTEYGNQYGAIEAERAQLESDDNQFYFNAAYQNALRKQLEGQVDYRTYLEGERAKIGNEQETRFQRSQAQINANSQNDLQMRQYNHPLRAQQVQLQKQRDAQNKAKTAGLVSGIGQTVGGLAMAGAGIATANPFLIAGGAGMTASGAGQVSGS